MVNIIGNIIPSIGGESESFDKRGSDCAGTSGAEDRTLNLGQSLTHAREILFINGRPLHPVHEFTISRAGGGSTVTFLVAIDDSDYIDGVVFT